MMLDAVVDSRCDKDERYLDHSNSDGRAQKRAAGRTGSHKGQAELGFPQANCVQPSEIPL